MHDNRKTLRAYGPETRLEEIERDLKLLDAARVAVELRLTVLRMQTVAEERDDVPGTGAIWRITFELVEAAPALTAQQELELANDAAEANDAAWRAHQDNAAWRRATIGNQAPHAGAGDEPPLEGVRSLELLSVRDDEVLK